jgi:antitoxin component YwqK of YwqJK toxin-antitoxin module
MLAYKAAKHGDTRVLLTLEIPEDALTNLKRSSIVNTETAKYRCNKAKVLKIEDDEGKTYETAESLCFKNKPLTYKVGEVVEEPYYDIDPEEICSSGIHFFLSHNIAYGYERPKPKNGLYQSWHENGQKFEELMYKSGKRDGLYQSYYKNGQKCSEIMFKYGKLEGLCQSWHANGNKCEEVMYKDGKMEGLYQQWYENGQKVEEVMYKDGKKEGLYQSWYKNSQKCVEKMYKDGKMEGLYQSWTIDGQLAQVLMYKGGICL